MDIKMKVLPDYPIAYIRRVGPYGVKNIEVMEALKQWAKERNLLRSAILFAIAQDNPTITPPNECRFDACIVLPENDPINDDTIQQITLSGGKYAVFTIKHTPDKIQKAYQDIPQYLRQHGYVMDDKPMMEKYTGDMTNEPNCEICVPVK